MLIALLSILPSTNLHAQQITAADGTVIVGTRVFTMLIPNYDRMAPNDYTVMVRKEPTAKSAKVTEIYFVEGLSNAVLLADATAKWVNVGGYKKQGYSNSYYLQNHTWYNGGGQTLLVADGLVPVYVESMADPEDVDQYSNPLCYIQRGTVIADVFEETDHDYVLKTVHTDLLIPKTSPVKKVAR
jgi:hypothetical protein